jgi:hypothetical protein
MPAGLTLQSISPQSLQGKTVSVVSLFSVSCFIYVLPRKAHILPRL